MLMSYIEIHVQVTPALQAVVKVLQLKSPLCDVIANNRQVFDLWPVPIIDLVC